MRVRGRLTYGGEDADGQVVLFAPMAPPGAVPMMPGFIFASVPSTRYAKVDELSIARVSSSPLRQSPTGAWPSRHPSGVAARLSIVDWDPSREIPPMYCGT